MIIITYLVNKLFYSLIIWVLIITLVEIQTLIRRHLINDYEVV